MIDQANAGNEEVVDLFSDFAVTDDGVWHPYRGDVEFLIARADNRKFQKRLTYFYKKHERLLDSKTEAADAKGEEILIQVQAETLLLGWKGKVAIEGQLAAYSVENAKRLLALPVFRKWVIDRSKDEQAYKLHKEAEDAGN